jgi:hypothetical protein
MLVKYGVLPTSALQAEAPSSSATNTTDKAQLHFDAFFKHPVLLTGGTLFGAIGLSIGFVHLLKSSPGALVKVGSCKVHTWKELPEVFTSGLDKGV